MLIQLKTKLPEELTDLGLAPGDKFVVPPEDVRELDAVRIYFNREHQKRVATVSKKHYKVL